jgi:hypothetical protein
VLEGYSLHKPVYVEGDVKKEMGSDIHIGMVGMPKLVSFVETPNIYA